MQGKNKVLSLEIKIDMKEKCFLERKMVAMKREQFNKLF